MTTLGSRIGAELGRAKQALGAGDIHSFRKSVKGLRAYLRLAEAAGQAVGQGCAGTPRSRAQLVEQARRARLELRDLARGFSAARDRQVLAGTARRVAREILGQAARRSLAGALRSAPRLGRTTGPVAGAREAKLAQAALSRLARKVKRWPALRLFEGPCLEALGVLYRRAYRQGRRVRRKPSASRLHEWRKRTRDLRHAAEVLTEVHPSRMARIATEARRLDQILGDDHDRVLLREHLGPEATPKLKKGIQRGRDRLLKKALRLGASLYSETPEEFDRRARDGSKKR
jgi:CHAD domain-containing protein